MQRAPIVFTHGAFCGGWAFERFAAPFAALHPVTVIDLPGHASGGSVTGISMKDYASAVAAEAARQPRPPILIGHSLGGLVSLLAAVEAPVAGVIALAPSAPWGVSGSSMEEAISAVSLYAFGPYWAQAITPDYGSFRRYCVDRLPGAEAHALHARMVPESGRALFETLNWWLDPMMTTLLQPERIGAPVLTLVGARDAIHPVATVRETARRLGARLEVLPDMSHWLIGEPGWEAVARLCLDWVSEIEGTRVAAE